MVKLIEKIKKAAKKLKFREPIYDGWEHGYNDGVNATIKVCEKLVK